MDPLVCRSVGCTPRKAQSLFTLVKRVGSPDNIYEERRTQPNQHQPFPKRQGRDRHTALMSDARRTRRARRDPNLSQEKGRAGRAKGDEMGDRGDDGKEGKKREMRDGEGVNKYWYVCKS